MNSLVSFLSSEFIRAFGWTLLHSLWQGMILFLVSAILMMLLRRKDPTIRYAVLYSLMALIPVFFLATFTVVYSAQTPVAMVSAGQGDIVPAPGLQPQATGLAPAGDRSVWFDSLRSFLDGSTHWMFLLWLSGFTIFFMKFTGSMLFLHRIRHYRLKEADRAWNERVRDLSHRIGLDQAVRLAESTLVSVPVTAGYLRPVILLPLGMLSGIPVQMIEAILLHELAHIRRRDYLLNLLQSFVEVVFFYHPVTWWLSGQIRQEREHICDDIALSVSKDRINYIKALTAMEEKNAPSVSLVPAITGPRKKLLHRITRLIHPEQARKGFMEGLVACFLLAGLITGISANVLNAGAADESAGVRIPTAYDLSGGESFENETNLLPMSFIDPPAETGIAAPVLNPSSGVTGPDTLEARSGSGKVTVRVYTDTIKEGDQETLEILVETLEDRIGDYERDKEMIEKEVIVLKKNAESLDSLRKVIVIKEGDSVRVISRGNTIVLPGDLDTTIVTEGGFQFYGFDPKRHAPGIIDLPEFRYEYFDDAVKWAEEAPRLYRDYEFQWQEADKMHREVAKQHHEMQRKMDEMRVIVAPPGAPEVWHWTEQSPPAAPAVKSAERIIRQELRDDGLTVRGKKYVVELDGKAMYINGERQPRETYKKYKKLVESLEPMVLEGEEMFRMIF